MSCQQHQASSESFVVVYCSFSKLEALVGVLFEAIEWGFCPRHPGEVVSYLHCQPQGLPDGKEILYGMCRGWTTKAGVREYADLMEGYAKVIEVYLQLDQQYRKV